MKVKEIKNLISILGEKGYSFVITSTIRELIEQNPDMSNERLGKEIRETVKSLNTIRKLYRSREEKRKINKLKKEIEVYENTLVGMKKRLQELLKTKS